MLQHWASQNVVGTAQLQATICNVSWVLAKFQSSVLLSCLIGSTKDIHSNDDVIRVKMNSSIHVHLTRDRHPLPSAIISRVTRAGTALDKDDSRSALSVWIWIVQQVLILLVCT